MQMRVSTFQEHSNSLYIQTAVNSEPMAPKLELSLGLAGASPFDPCPGRESLHSEPMIIEQQNTVFVPKLALKVKSRKNST
ncbi:hypothetical protein YC2023_020012 [Brassica napus]